MESLFCSRHGIYGPVLVMWGSRATCAHQNFPATMNMADLRNSRLDFGGPYVCVCVCARVYENYV